MTRSVLATVLVLFPALASAQNDAARQEADRHFDEGVRLFEAADYADALREFETAKAWRETASVTYNMANCYRALGRRVEAITAYRRFMEIKAERLTADERTETERIVADMLGRVAELTVRTDPDGADIFVNGRPIRTQPTLFDLGTTVVAEARKDGYRSARTQARLTAPGPFELVLTLERAPDLTPAAAAAGSGDGSAPSAATHGDPADTESGGSSLPWILAGAGVVAVGAGVAIFFLTRSEEPQADWRVTTP
jgi:tetratricopeptide (TPR) repeat protein